MAEHLDVVLLQNLATAAAYTGVMLSLLTPWGIFRFWWVTVKFVLTVGGLYLGIAHLGGWLHQAVDAAAAAGNGAGPAFRVMVGGVAMIAALAFMAWLSTAKPWGRTRAAGRASGPAPRRLVRDGAGRALPRHRSGPGRRPPGPAALDREPDRLRGVPTGAPGSDREARHTAHEAGPPLRSARESVSPEPLPEIMTACSDCTPRPVTRCAAGRPPASRTSRSGRGERGGRCAHPPQRR